MSHDSQRNRQLVPQWMWSVWTITRFPTILGYNVAYLLIGVAFAPLAVVSTSGPSPTVFGAFALAVGLMKGQSSIADAIHDAPIDRKNPTKATLPTAVELVGEERARSLLVLQLIGSMFLYGWLTYRLDDPAFLVAGTVANAFGYTYSYPPRFKERGVWNHLITTGVDVGCVLLPAILIVTGGLSPFSVVVLGVAFAYTFAYHVLHQAADTHYDREVGVRTFTTELGVTRSLDVAVGAFAVAGVLAVGVELLIVATVAFAYAGYGFAIRLNLAGTSAVERTDRLSRRFDIGRCAIALNLSLAAAVLLRHLPTVL